VKQGTVILAAALIATVAGSCWLYLCATAHSSDMLKAPNGELEWLREEFALDDSRFAAIKTLHQAHIRQCVELCRQVDMANARVARLTARDDQVTPEVRDALGAAATRETRCREAMLEHIFQIADQIPTESRQHYLDMMLPHALPAKAAHHERM